MLRTVLKFFFALFMTFTICTCIDPYLPDISSHKSFLTIEGLITNENRSYIVRLSRTMQRPDSIPQKVADASVFISDETGEIANLVSSGEGTYKSDSLVFNGEVGKTYVLHVITSNGTEYRSDSCTMLPVPDIDTIYFEKDQQTLNNESIIENGISIYLDSKPGLTGKYFLRWEYEETWKFKVPSPKAFTYINDTTIIPLPDSEIKQYCWKSSKSGEILTNEVYSGSSNYIKKQPVKFIISDESDRLSLRYSILVRQYSVSQKEYNFWNNLRQVNETQGNIFGEQPFAVLSNIKNINNPSESVLGYFQVSAVSQKRKYINSEEIVPLNLPKFNYTCITVAYSPSDIRTSPLAPPLTWDDLYNLFANASGYSFVEPLYNIDDSKQLYKLVFTSVQCADCELTGTIKKPIFWIEK